jgi:hypothetical protein
VVAHNFRGGLNARGNAWRITFQDTHLTHSDNGIDCSGAAPSEITFEGSQILVLGGSSIGAKKTFFLATQSLVGGPSAMVDYLGEAEDCTHIQPHQRWASGLLVDSVSVTGGNIEYMNRGNLGSGHGWTMGWGVVWNSSAPSFLIQEPPGTTNWCIGCEGTQSVRAAYGDDEVLPIGQIDSPDTPVAPASLYLAQLCDRLGPSAVKAIGY